MDAADHAAVFLVFAHGTDDEVFDAAADVDKRADGCQACEDTGQLVPFDVRHPDVVQSLAEFVEPRHAVDDYVAEDHVGALAG